MKDSKYIKSFILVLLMGIAIISCAQKQIVVKIEYDQSVGPVTLKDKTIQTYSVNFNKNLSKESVLERAKQLTNVSSKPLDFDKLQEMEGGLMVLRSEKDPSASFEMDTKSGNFLYNSGLSEYKKNNNTPDLILGEKALSIALQHLEKLGLLPSKQEMNLAHIGGLDMAVLKDDNTTEVYKKLATVRYNRILDDVPVMGDSRIVLQMGEMGNLVGLIHYWGEITDRRKVETGELIANKEIKAEAEKRIKLAANGAKRIIVEKANFVLYDDGKGQIEPAYYIQARFYYEVKNKDEKEYRKYDIPYDFYVPILKKPLAFYPHMETANKPSMEVSGSEITPKDDE